MSESESCYGSDISYLYYLLYTDVVRLDIQRIYLLFCNDCNARDRPQYLLYSIRRHSTHDSAHVTGQTGLVVVASTGSGRRKKRGPRIVSAARRQQGPQGSDSTAQPPARALGP